MGDFERVKDPRLADFAADLSRAVGRARGAGVSCDLACSVLVTVAADYGRTVYSDEYVERLCDVMRQRLKEPYPGVEGDH